MSSLSPRISRTQSLLQAALQHHQAGRLTAASSGYAELRRLDPKIFEGFHLGGTVALQLGKLNEALPLLQRAVQLRPGFGVTHMCLGLVLGQLGRAVEAEKHLRSATQFEPKNFEAWCNLASILVMGGKMDEAVESYRKSLKLAPQHAQSWAGLGSVLQMQGKSQEAYEHQTRALALEPGHPKAQSSRAQALQSLNRLDEARRDFDAHLLRQPDDLEAASFRVFLLNYDAALSREYLFGQHQAVGRQIILKAGAASRRTFPNTQDSHRRLRIAFLSPDFREHSVAFFIEPILRHLNRDQFEIFLYHDHWCVDDTSRRLQSYATQWRHLVGQPDAIVETQILKDAPDALIELAGYSGFNRMALLGRRLAPVQISYLGYPNTTGIPTIDYRFTDRHADPVGDSEAQHTESLVRFAETGWTYQPPHYAPEPAPAPAANGSPFTFGSFNNLAKLNDATLRLWAEILRAIPSSRLLIKGFSMDEVALRKKALQAGIDDHQLLLLPARASAAEHLSCYARIDVALDPFPYSGTTTTCEALWMGVPVITLRGDRHASRVGVSLLHAVGAPEWIADNPAHYVEIAKSLAADAPRLSHWRQSLRDRMKASALMDHLGQADRFGAGIRQCWIEKMGKETAPCAQIRAEATATPVA